MRRARAPRFRSHFALLLLSCSISSALISSGCASVSAENSAAPASAKVSVVPSSVDFKEVVVGQKNSQTLKITNLGKDPLDLNAIHVSGINFSLSFANVPLVLASGANTSVSVVYAPSAASSASGSLIIYSPDLKAPLSVPLSGAGEKSAPALQISPASISFGTRATNSSNFQSVSLKNTGNVALKVSSLALSNSAFSVTGLSSGVSLAPDQQLNFQLWFHPTSTGSWSASLSVASSSLPSPIKLAVTGSATNSAVTPPTSATSHSVNLDWNASNSSVAGYHVYRGASSGGPYVRISGSATSSLSYKDSSVQSGDRYFYVVTAVASNGSESTFSNEVAADIPN